MAKKRKSAAPKKVRATKTVKSGLVPIRSIRPSPENNELYAPVDVKDPEIEQLVKSIRERGILEPLVITTDGYILSGHRRFVAAKLAGLKKVPVRSVPISRAEDPDGFLVLLREFNRQRDKTNAEKLREEIVSVSADEAYYQLKNFRDRNSIIRAPTLEIEGFQSRARISESKQPFLEAIKTVLDDLDDYLPVSARQVHYALLNDPPLTHASKPNSRYQNTKQCYKQLIDLLTRARLEGSISLDAIGDDTRPVQLWGLDREPRQYVRERLKSFALDYRRDLLQSQPNHIEIVGEKNTVASILEPIAANYCIPLTTGRGYCSLPPRDEMSIRYFNSGKQNLILLFVTDFDPDGEEIVQSFVRSMRDDFGIKNIRPIKVALTSEQVEQYDLPPIMTAKETSSRRNKFVSKHGENVFELEALRPSDLQELLRGVIESVIDQNAFEDELAAEREDAAFLSAVRQRVVAAVGKLD